MNGNNNHNDFQGFSLSPFDYDMENDIMKKTQDEDLQPTPNLETEEIETEIEDKKIIHIDDDSDSESDSDSDSDSCSSDDDCSDDNSSSESSSNSSSCGVESSSPSAARTDFNQELKLVRQNEPTSQNNNNQRIQIDLSVTKNEASISEKFSSTSTTEVTRKIINPYQKKESCSSVAQLPNTISPNSSGSSSFIKQVVNPYKSSRVNNTNNNNMKSIDTSNLYKTKSSFYRPDRTGNFHYPKKKIIEPQALEFNLKTRPFSSRRLIPVSQIFGSFPSETQKFFNAKFHSFNHMQSEIAPTLTQTNDNVVITAPTGAGKTVIFEIAMWKLFNQSSQVVKGDASSKVIYIAPSKALCEERYQDWRNRLPSYLNVSMVTGDTNPSCSFQNVATSHLILTTPEKFDAMTRRWNSDDKNLTLLGTVKLLLMDEVHFIGDVSRGACLESIVVRMKTIQAAKAQNTRIVAVSATLPNVIDIASFLECPNAHIFDASYRPVPLTTHVVGAGWNNSSNGNTNTNQFLFDRNLAKYIPNLIEKYSDTKATIIFCHTKKDTENLATTLSSQRDYTRTLQSRKALKELTNTTSSLTPTLSKTITRGVAFHHAGLTQETRTIVEQNFSSGKIRVLCATSTLAMGVNLPAHLVIIKGTKAWRGQGQGHQEIDSGTLLQMMGRAGRPGFDTMGKAIILTDKRSVKKYEQLSAGLDVAESQLLSMLIEVLNCEVSQKVVSSQKTALQWIKNTFFFIRVKKNPRFYKMIPTKSNQEMESYLMNMCMKALEDLHQNDIICMDSSSSSCCTEERDSDDSDYEEDDNDIQKITITPLEASHIMSQHMLTFDTMKKLMVLSHDELENNSNKMTQKKLLDMLSSCKSLHFPVRRSEKKLLNQAHKSLKYSVQPNVPNSKVRIQTPIEKAHVLLQASISQIYLEDFTLRQEMSQVVNEGARILEALQDYCVISCVGNGKIAVEALLLRRSLASSLWGGSDSFACKEGILNQIKGVGIKTTKKLQEHNIYTFQDVLSQSSNAIEQACGRKSPFGQELRGAVTKILNQTLSISAYIREEDGDGGRKKKLLVVKLDRSSESGNENNDYNDSKLVSYTLSVHTDIRRTTRSISSFQETQKKSSSPNNKTLMMFRTGICKPSQHQVDCPKEEELGGSKCNYYIKLISNLVGMDVEMTIDDNGSPVTIAQHSFFGRKKTTGSVTKTKTKNSLSIITPSPNKNFDKMLPETTVMSGCSNKMDRKRKVPTFDHNENVGVIDLVRENAMEMVKEIKDPRISVAGSNSKKKISKATSSLSEIKKNLLLSSSTALMNENVLNRDTVSVASINSNNNEVNVMLLSPNNNSSNSSFTQRQRKQQQNGIVFQSNNTNIQRRISNGSSFNREDFSVASPTIPYWKRQNYRNNTTIAATKQNNNVLSSHFENNTSRTLCNHEQNRRINTETPMTTSTFSSSVSRSYTLNENNTINNNTSRSLSYKWQKEKKQQGEIQKRAFCSKKENPFSSFKFDPNNAESNLEALSKKSSTIKHNSTQQQRLRQSSRRFISTGNWKSPSSSSTATGIAYSLLKAKKRARTQQSVYGSGNKATSGIDLLRLKANEQQEYVDDLRRKLSYQSSQQNITNYNNVSSASSVAESYRPPPSSVQYHNPNHFAHNNNSGDLLYVYDHHHQQQSQLQRQFGLRTKQEYNNYIEDQSYFDHASVNHGMDNCSLLNHNHSQQILHRYPNEASVSPPLLVNDDDGGGVDTDCYRIQNHGFDDSFEFHGNHVSNINQPPLSYSQHHLPNVKEPPLTMNWDEYSHNNNNNVVSQQPQHQYNEFSSMHYNDNQDQLYQRQSHHSQWVHNDNNIDMVVESIPQQQQQQQQVQNNNPYCNPSAITTQQQVPGVARGYDSLSFRNGDNAIQQQQEIVEDLNQSINENNNNNDHSLEDAFF